MSALTKALSISMKWTERYLPEYAASFLSGLEFDEILESVEILGSPIPDELYILYQWRNGTNLDTPSFIFPTFEFIPLERVVELNYQADNDLMIREMFMLNEQCLLPFMESNGSYCAIVLSSRSTLKAPVVYIGRQGSGTYVAFSSVTSMFCSLAECFTTGAYYLDEDGYIDSHSTQVAEVLRKHNPQLVEQALTNIRILETDFDFSFDTRMFISHTLQALERFRPPEMLDILSEALVKYSSDSSRKGAAVCLMINQTLNNLAREGLTQG